MKRKFPFIVFIHIERSGGTTFNKSMLSNSIGVMAAQNKKIIDLVADRKRKENIVVDFTVTDLQQLLFMYPFIRMIGGHHTRVYEDYGKTLNRDCFFFTFVRNPIDRYLSHFNYQRIAMGIDWSIQEFVNNSRFNNWQTYRIAGEKNFMKALDYVNNRFDFIGITEKYDESLLILKQLIGKNSFNIHYKKENSIISKSNRNEYKIIKYDELNADLQNKIKENNKYDIELYDHILNNIYSKYVSNYAGDLAKDLLYFNEANIKYSEKTFNVYSNKILRKYINSLSSLIRHKYRY